MADRLTSITTGTGDDGTTGIVGGERLGKDDPRIEAIGCIDELNTFIGSAHAELMLLSAPVGNALAQRLLSIQHDLFDLGGELAMPPEAILADSHHARLSRWQEEMNATLEPLANFILPGGSRALAAINAASLVYLNRLSDLLFVAGRYLAAETGTPEHLWQQNLTRN